MKEFIRSITDSLSQTGQNLESQVGKLLPLDGEYYWLGDKVGSWTDYLIYDDIMDPDEVSEWFAGKVYDGLQLDRMDRPTRIVRPSNMPETITILPTSSLSGEKKSVFELLEEDFVEVLTEAKPVFGRREILEPDRSSIRESDNIIAPFSRYTPTVLWPFSSESGKRYTVHDLGEEELDFFGKPIAEYAIGRELDKVGALPGFHMWGDPLLGTGPVVIGGTAVALLGLTAFLWGPAIGRSLASTAQSALFGTIELAKSVGSKAKDVAKAPF